MERISSLLKECLAKVKSEPDFEPLFVFPTDVQKNSWIEWAASSSESGQKAVSADFFCAWDDFKRQCILSDSDASGLVSVPALMRKVFVQDLFRKKSGSLKKIISSDDAEKKSIYTFTDWLAKILPSLKLWEKHHDIFIKNGNSDDEENDDFDFVYKEYLKFLKDGNFYEPSFVETKFNSFGKKIFIFFPEIHEDISEYKSLLEESPDVTIINIPQEEFAREVECVLYPDARMELRRAALQIKKLQDSGADLRRVALTVPDLENISPYVEREFRLYEIPFIVRNGIPCARNCGGDIFSKIFDCIKTNRSFASMRALLTDGFLPWKDKELNLELVRAGTKLRCICPLENGGDIWKESLQALDPLPQNLLEHYDSLFSRIEKFRTCKSFKQLETAWFDFKEHFLDEEKFSGDAAFELTNKILGKMLAELSEYVSIEEKCMVPRGYILNDYLEFFINEMNQTTYNRNEKKYGVNIFSYKVASCADFDWHFIINANQADITIPLKKLSFVKDEAKRRKFGLEDENADGSAMFVHLYNLQCREGAEKTVIFSSSAKNFNGAAITHTALKEFDIAKFSEDLEDSEKAAEIKNNFPAQIEKFNSLQSLDEFDFVTRNRNTFIEGGKISETSEMQKKAFYEWKRKFQQEADSSPGLSQTFKEKIDAALGKKRFGACKLSASAMKVFFSCPQKWLLQNVMGIQEEEFSPRIAEANEIGTLYHKIIELMFKAIAIPPATASSNAKPSLPFYSEQDGEKIEALLDKIIPRAIGEISSDSLPKQSALAMDVLKSQMPSIKKTMRNFFIALCSKSDGDEKQEKGKFGGYTIEGTELRSGSTPKFKPVEIENPSGNKILCSGAIDCLLSRVVAGKKELVVIDYKSGVSPSISECIVQDDSALENFQIAMYVTLAESWLASEYALKPQEEIFVADALFYSLKETEDGFGTTYIIDANKSSRAKNVSREDFEPTLAAFKEYARFFADKAANYDFEISSDKADKNYVNASEDCKKCSFKSICRKTFNVGKGE